MTELVSENDPPNSGIYKLRISFEEWANGTQFICSAKHKEGTKVQTRGYSRENDYNVQYCYWDMEPEDNEDDCAANTDIAFVFLFLFSLFYGVGAIKVK
ncbi:hypothetical protein AGOR_G00197940 [Albula goreensis]|uniref:Uncharacterized protein n=1 Tax=Albula goreensis TaxID=1534307 RepID=A0A8T3CVK4_9TELE|nr:hypothetical protein AGOR_G00197940 [Albula goreensis]